MSFERGFHFINTLQVAKRIIKTRSEPLRKNYSQKEAGMNPESTELTSSSHLSLFYTVSKEVPASVERGKGWRHSSLSWIATPPRGLLKTPNPVAKLPIPFSMLSELWNIHISWSSPSGGSIAIDMTHKMSHPLMQRTLPSILYGYHAKQGKKRVPVVYLDWRDNW